MHDSSLVRVVHHEWIGSNGEGRQQRFRQQERPRNVGQHYSFLHGCRQGCGQGIPEVKDKLTGMVFRMFMIDASVVDLTC